MGTSDPGKTGITERQRIEGFDLARAVALMAMIIVNYTSLMQIGTFSPPWIDRSVDFVFGRAATVFVILARSFSKGRRPISPLGVCGGIF